MAVGALVESAWEGEQVGVRVALVGVLVHVLEGEPAVD